LSGLPFFPWGCQPEWDVSCANQVYDVAAGGSGSGFPHAAFLDPMAAAASLIKSDKKKKKTSPASSKLPNYERSTVSSRPKTVQHGSFASIPRPLSASSRRTPSDASMRKVPKTLGPEGHLWMPRCARYLNPRTRRTTLDASMRKVRGIRHFSRLLSRHFPLFPRRATLTSLSSGYPRMTCKCSRLSFTTRSSSSGLSTARFAPRSPFIPTPS